MNRSNVNSRQQACYYLGVQENATQDEIKRAYHLLVKRYHPDSNPQYGAKEYYINVCEAYEYLMQNPYTDSKQVNNNTVFVHIASAVFYVLLLTFSACDTAL